jgi:hypothetical protein
MNMDTPTYGLWSLGMGALGSARRFPDWRASHEWIGLFSVAPMTSVRVWIDGIIFSIVFGWVTAVVFGLVYNRLIRR